MIDIESSLMQVQIHAADDGGGTLADLDRFEGQIKSSQAGGTCRIHGQAWTGEIQRKRDTVGDAPEKRVRHDLIAGVLFLGAENLIHRPYRTDVYADLAGSVFAGQ